MISVAPSKTSTEVHEPHHHIVPDYVNGVDAKKSSREVSHQFGFNWRQPPSIWQPLCHPRVDEVSCEVDGYFLQHWPFPSKKTEETFLKAGFSRVTCLYFPLAKDDRIHFACRLLTVLFLIDGMTTFGLSPLPSQTTPSTKLKNECRY
jgi:hypothetical protein